MSLPYSRMVPLLNRVLIKRIEQVNKSASGIILNESKTQYGVVLEIGAGDRSKNQNILPMAVKVGDTVLIPEYGGTPIKLQNQELLIFRDTDILGILHR